jgi:hypothetical protein
LEKCLPYFESYFFALFFPCLFFSFHFFYIAKNIFTILFLCALCALMANFHFNVIYATINTTIYILYGWNRKVYFTYVSWDVASYVKKPTFLCSDWRVLGSLSITLSLQFLMRNISHNDNKVMENDWNYYWKVKTL